jgi:membrane associated rhomboid family serine protease
MTALFGYMWNYRIGLEAVCLSYAIVARERQYYRLVSAAVTHVSAMHILFNMGSLLNLAFMEMVLGSAWYAETTVLLLFCQLGRVRVALCETSI